MKRKLPIGIQDYQRLRNDAYYTIDKTMMIAEFLERGSAVTLITRPRRFGKTLNMSMMANFFDITKDSQKIFEGLAIMDTPYAKEMNQYPVIFLSFANCKGSFAFTKKFLFESIEKEYTRYRACFDAPSCNDNLKQRIQTTYEALCTGESFVRIDSAIKTLCELLTLVYRKKPMLFIDEYDTPFIEAHVHGYYSEMHDVLASLLRSSLKGNEYVQYGMLTGIQRVAKENIFSDLNNLDVCDVKGKKYAQYFGFTKEETATLLECYGVAYDEQVKEMYDGYRMGNVAIYNPWSIITYASNQELRPYWVNTSSNAMIKKAMEQSDVAFKKDFEELVQNSSIETQVLMETSFFEQSQTSSLWGLFVNAGYLTIEKTISIMDDWYKVKIPNKEVQNEYKSLTAHYLKIGDAQMIKMMMSLKQKDVNAFFQCYQEILVTLPSYFDLKHENSYHVFMLSMCAWFRSDYTILSNKEIGKGRADLILKKKKNFLPNIIMEFKYKEQKDDGTINEDALHALARKAVKQIKDKNYSAGLHGDTLIIGLAHHQKEASMDYEEMNI